MKPKGKKKIPLQVYLSEDLFSRLKQKAQELEVPMSDLVRQILDVALRYGFIVPGEEPPRVEAKINKQELEELIQKILEEYEARRKKKSIWKRLFYR